MNILTVNEQTSIYISEKHPVIIIDGITLDSYLHALYPDKSLLGLIPTITDWISMDEEADLIMRRYDSNQHKVVLPVLMCSDDCDLTCTVIVAEVSKNNKEVIWHRIGIESSQLGLPYDYELIGTTVIWFDRIPQLKFDKKKYHDELKVIYKRAEQ